MGMGLKVVARAGVRKGIGMGDGVKVKNGTGVGSRLSRDRNGGGRAVQDQEGI